MKITIIVFSPAQNTLVTAQLLEQSFLKRNAQVQLIDFTARKELADQASITSYLQEKVKTHDLLCIGGPVYAGHLQENVKNIIKALPLPDEKWGVLVVPFVTYGGVHSSVALKEAGKMLKKRERKNIAGMKITAFHSLTKNFSFKIHESKPGDEELSIIETLTERVFETVGKENYEINDISSSFSYNSFGENLLYKIFSEKLLHKIMYGKIKIDCTKCIGCGICAKKCPVQIIEIKNKKAEQKKNGVPECIYCCECYHACKVGAISIDLSKPEKYLSQVNSKSKFESPLSAVYPL